MLLVAGLPSWAQLAAPKPSTNSIELARGCTIKFDVPEGWVFRRAYGLSREAGPPLPQAQFGPRGAELYIYGLEANGPNPSSPQSIEVWAMTRLLRESSDHTAKVQVVELPHIVALPGRRDRRRLTLEYAEVILEGRPPVRARTVVWDSFCGRPIAVTLRFVPSASAHDQEWWNRVQDQLVKSIEP